MEGKLSHRVGTGCLPESAGSLHASLRQREWIKFIGVEVVAWVGAQRRRSSAWSGYERQASSAHKLLRNFYLPSDICCHCIVENRVGYAGMQMCMQDRKIKVELW